jgi:hypothetical protein
MLVLGRFEFTIRSTCCALSWPLCWCLENTLRRSFLNADDRALNANDRTQLLDRANRGQIEIESLMVGVCKTLTQFPTLTPSRPGDGVSHHICSLREATVRRTLQANIICSKVQWIYWSKGSFKKCFTANRTRAIETFSYSTDSVAH